MVLNSLEYIALAALGTTDIPIFEKVETSILFRVLAND
jgi:hypothetical protein